MVGSALRTGDNTQMKNCAKNRRFSNLYHLNMHKQSSSHNEKVYRQNVRGLKGKLSLLSNFLYSEFPHIVCITEHHHKDQEMNLASIEHYKLSAKFCRQLYRYGGTCIFVHDSINYDTIPTEHFCKEMDLEMCAIKLNVLTTNFVIIVI
jgi:exonuclease III